MNKVLVLVIIVCSLAAGQVMADRLILTPTGRTLTTGGLKGEYAASSDLDGSKIYWANIGVSRLEIEGARFQGFGVEDTDAISAQVSIIPETSFTPAIALGVRDISDQTKGKGLLYDGQSIYLAASKSLPGPGGGVPFALQDVKVHGGIGTGSLSGVFFGVEGKLPMGIEFMSEFDTKNFNYAASYKVGPAMSVRAASIHGDIFYGALFSTAF